MKPRNLGKRQVTPAEIVWTYEPTDRQREAHRAPQRHKMYGGAVGGGKSWWLCAEAIRLSILFPGNRGYLCRNLIDDFKRTTLVTFGKVVPDDLVRKHFRNDKIMALRNGSEILYGGLGGEEDLERIKSLEIGFFGIDEATECLFSHWKMLCSRLRWTLPTGEHPRFFGLLTANPEPGWVKDQFVDKKAPDRVFIQALPTDNPHNPPDYVDNLTATYAASDSEDWIKRYVKGSWDAFEGQVYKEFDRSKHVVAYEALGSPHWNFFRVLDHGYVNPTCCLLIGMDEDGRMHVVDEHYESGLTIAQNVFAIRQRWPGEMTTIADPSVFARTQQKNGRVWTFADEYREHGLPLRSPYENSGHQLEGLGINLVKQRLNTGALIIHERCENTLSEMVRYRWRDMKSSAANVSNLSERPVDKDNHAMDCLRYACCWKPMEAQLVPKPTEEHWTTHYAREYVHQMRRPLNFAGRRFPPNRKPERIH